MDELLRSRNFDYKNIGELRKHVLSSFVEKSPYGFTQACVVGTIRLWRRNCLTYGERRETK